MMVLIYSIHFKFFAPFTELTDPLAPFSFELAANVITFQ